MSLRADEYEKTVKSASWERLKWWIQEFIDHFDPSKKNVVLIVGGAASQLFRARIRFDRPPQRPEDTSFDLTWIAPGIRRQPDLIEIGPSNRDQDARIIVADGAVEFCFAHLHPYEKAVSFFSREFNWLLFTWDWRRNTQRAVDLLNRVIREITRSTGAKGIFLVGHSMGGMVAKLFLSQSESTPDYAESYEAIAGLITVGTPFYGYVNQLLRIYEGVPEFNSYSSARRTAQIYSSFTGLYSLLPIDLCTYRDVGETLGLSSYPVMAGDGITPVDPFKTKRPIYPPWFRDEELEGALTLRQQLASPLPDDMTDAAFHLRTVKSHPPTLSAVTWRQERYDPHSAHLPLTTSNGMGDETIPSWSARLASTPNANVCDFPIGEHMTLMEQNDVLGTIKKIITGKDYGPADHENFRQKYGPDPDVASPKELEDFLSSLGGREIPKNIPKRLGWRLLQNTLM